MYEVDVNGTHNVLEAAAAAGVGQVLVTTSAVAYGAFPDNPVPLTEDDPVRGVARFSYARDKTESDRICQLWASEHPDRVLTIVRPCIVFGPNVDNYLVRPGPRPRSPPTSGTLDQQIQFVHEDDVVEAVTGLLLGRHGGAYNVAGDGLMTMRECGELIGAPVRKMPLRVYRALARVMWRLRASEAPPGQIDFALYSWIVSNEKLKRTSRLEPEHSSRETFEITMRKHGKMPPAERGGGPVGRCYSRRLAPRAVSSAGRAPARQAGGHWFEPSTAHVPKAPLRRGFLLLAGTSGRGRAVDEDRLGDPAAERRVDGNDEQTWLFVAEEGHAVAPGCARCNGLAPRLVGRTVNRARELLVRRQASGCCPDPVVGRIAVAVGHVLESYVGVRLETRGRAAERAARVLAVLGTRLELIHTTRVEPGDRFRDRLRIACSELNRPSRRCLLARRGCTRSSSCLPHPPSIPRSPQERAGFGDLVDGWAARPPSPSRLRQPLRTGGTGTGSPER